MWRPIATRQAPFFKSKTSSDQKFFPLWPVRNYPIYDLAEAVKVAVAVRDLGGGNSPATKSLLAQQLKYAENGPSFFQRVGAAKAFGLIDGWGALGWSRKLENHKHAVSLFVTAHSFCRVHSTLGCTPAVGLKLVSENWTIERLIEEATK
jgi:hypothetical protein